MLAPPCLASAWQGGAVRRGAAMVAGWIQPTLTDSSLLSLAAATTSATGRPFTAT
jgi:hypothetical protein